MNKKTPYINRELSWLDFNMRVLEEAQDEANPLLERLKFLSIFCSNLDEFFMVRVGRLLDEAAAGIFSDDITGMPPQKQLEQIFAKATDMYKVYNGAQSALLSLLARQGIKQAQPDALSGRELSALEKKFRLTSEPLLSAIIVDSKHPFPYLPGGSVFVALRLKRKSNEKLGLLLFPESAEKVVFTQSPGLSFFLVEDAAKKFSSRMFPRQEVVETGKFRVTRSADMALDDDSMQGEENYSRVMQSVLDIRKRLRAVRLNTDLPASSPLAQQLAARLKLDKAQVFTQSGPLDMAACQIIAAEAKAKGFPRLFFEEMKSVYAPGLSRRESIMAQVKSKDYLMLHPYVNFDAVLALLREAASDESVIAIRQTLYRLSGESEVVRCLLEAAQNGKDVTALVEIKARFDEAKNINWAAKLESAGCRVIYGKDNLKVHSKLLLITRKGARGFSYTAHVSTGNYNERTASLYTDIGVLTSNEDVTHDIMLFFRELDAGAPEDNYRLLCVSPEGIRRNLYELIDGETQSARSGGKGRIIMKMNSLADRGIIDRLIAASKAGVYIDLIVRGVCCLKAGIPGLTENIRVTSVVGRFLEHSRVYWFSCGGNEKLFISSADMMTRNLDKRMEVLFPVLDRSLAGKIKESLAMQTGDFVKGRRMLSDGSYGREPNAGGADSQSAQYAKCLEDYRLSLARVKKPRRAVLRRALGSALVKLGWRIAPVKSE